MTTQSSPPGWPLTGPSRAPPLPTSTPPPSYSPKHYAPNPPHEIRRRPLSSSQGNALVGPHGIPSSPAQAIDYTDEGSGSVLLRKSSFEAGDDAFMRQPIQARQEPEIQDEFEKRHARRKSSGLLPMTQSLPYRPQVTTNNVENIHQPQSGIISSVGSSPPGSRHTSGSSYVRITGHQQEPSLQPLQYHHQAFEPRHDTPISVNSDASRAQVRRVSPEMPPPVPSHGRLTPSSNHLSAHLPRPSSAYSSTSEGLPNRTLSPGTPNRRTPSPSRHSPDTRPMSFVDLLSVPYPQPPPAPASLDNTQLRSSVGENATLLNTKKTLEMYRANVKKTNDPTIQYEFAVFMVNSAAEAVSEQPSSSEGPDPSISSQADLLREARNILQKLSDRSYPFAQYYLADGYASGLFNKGVPNNDHAFPLFIAASKHGHAEAGYRAALCYEFGWGCRKDLQKAVQFYRQSASKNHPGAMSRLGLACMVGDMGLTNRYREGLKWLKRAAESADFQYNSAPYELGLLHETGYGDDIFRDPSYAAQLFTQSADLGHVEANFRLGDAYEHGKLDCPKDPALSVHFYTGAAQRGHPLAMMALCAWYMVGAEPVLDKDENEACEWAKKAAETGKTLHSFSSFPLFLLCLVSWTW